MTKSALYPVVSKFGGTSMANAVAMKRSAEICIKQKSDIVVVSATSGTTNQLLALIQAAETGPWEKAEELLGQLQSKHKAIAHDLELSGLAVGELDELLSEIHTLARGIFLMRECSTKARDRMQSFGERLSSLLFTKALSDIAAKPVKNFDVRLVLKTDNHYGKATPLIEETRIQAKKYWADIGSTVYVTQGFIGMDPAGNTTTLGRGGSDYSASLIGEAINAGVVEIWTDVDGIATTDPRLYAGAMPIRKISFTEAAEMAVFGAKVLHPTTLTPAMRQDIPVFVGSSFESEKNGTWIARTVENPPIFRAVALKKDQVLLTLSTPKMLNAHGFLARVFNLFEKHHISVDAITTSEVSLAMTVESAVAGQENFLKELSQLGDVSLEKGQALVSLIGNTMNHSHGLAVQIFEAIGDINVRMICLGASKHNFCVLVDESKAGLVVERLHRALIDPLTSYQAIAAATQPVETTQV